MQLHFDLLGCHNSPKDRSQCDTTAIPVVHQVIMTDAIYAHCFVMAVASTAVIRLDLEEVVEFCNARRTLQTTEWTGIDWSKLSTRRY